MRLPREKDDWIKSMVTFLLSQAKTNDIFKREQPPKRRCFGFDYHKYPEILVNLRIMHVMLIRTTKTSTGLKVKAHFVRKHYKTGDKVSDSEMNSISIKPHTTFTMWNYTLNPRTRM